jgi:hypothetical protein
VRVVRAPWQTREMFDAFTTDGNWLAFSRSARPSAQRLVVDVMSTESAADLFSLAHCSLL